MFPHHTPGMQKNPSLRGKGIFDNEVRRDAQKKNDF
tara:strand:- start:84 stop:191 length:108 start_codon:yes stop_codon:yes gene_type:complete